MARVEITTFEYSKQDEQTWQLPFDYHCLYILENGDYAYIGETKRPLERSKEHKHINDLCSAYSFSRIHIITGQTFEETPAKHYETLLRRLMSGDGKFKILNAKRDEWQHYYRKNEFELCFDQLWLALEKKGLVMHKDFQTVLNLSSYKFSPHIELTALQHEALTSILHTIDSGEMQPHRDGFLPRPILISGDAGTGKTVVATSLFYKLRTLENYQHLKIGLVYAVSNTRAEIQELFKSVPRLRKKDVITPSAVAKEHYDIIICDEAQRLRRPKNAGRFYTSQMKKINDRLGIDEDSDELDWILMNSTCQILFYDEKQFTAPSDIPKESFMERLYARNRGFRPVALREQMRIRAGERYVPYIYNILYEKNPEPIQFDNYEFQLFHSFDKMLQKLEEKEKDTGLSRMSSGYAWEWKSKHTPEVPDIQIEGKEIWWNQQTEGWLRNPSSNQEMGSIYTLSGLDLNYTAVVIGPELYYDLDDNTIKIDKSNFFDNKLKTSTTEEELKRFILNTYGSLLTRGILGTYVYVCDLNLRNYLQKYIPTF
ncbi:DUF2075 domain-containing protein [Faecalicatena sp. AGMB00832]|uniref:DUF2075 domain-containing protein n=1 Tax=Faecalicatena faecalis TaxID=2726362 RepID=A0ABS6D390_9FIRM|nr:DNA/RNA helicase domain-containing protein [Faecalicatena faecalis]MBU3876054.1 DUF2075 domain-containing protein [Faecalicatena faecalis]